LTSTLPADEAGGVRAVIVVAFTSVTAFAGRAPKKTATPSEKFAPLIVSDVPPLVAPLSVEMPDIFGALAPGVAGAGVTGVCGLAFAPGGAALKTVSNTCFSFSPA